MAEDMVQAALDRCDSLDDADTYNEMIEEMAAELKDQLGDLADALGYRLEDNR
jgi:hypothetical protein